MVALRWSTFPPRIFSAIFLLSMIARSTGYTLPYITHTVTDANISSQISGSLGARSIEKKGTCPPDTVWSRILDTPKAGATCCPYGYEARSRPDRVLTNLVGIFCCPINTQGREYCAGKDQVSAVPPDICPQGTHSSMVSCVGGYLAEDKAMSERNLPSLVLAASLGVLWVVLG